MSKQLIDIAIPTMKSIDSIAPMICDLQGFSRGCNVIYTCQAGSASENRNRALKQCTGDIVIMLDDDISGFYDGWVEDMIKPLEDESVIITSAQLVNLDGTQGNQMVPGITGQIIEVPRVPTAAIAFRTRQAVLFCEEFIGSGFEDDYWCLQMQELFPSGKIMVNGTCRLVHANEAKNQTGKYREKNEATFYRLIKGTILEDIRNGKKPQSITYYSEHGQDKWLNENIFKNKRNGVFAEIGAIDGLITSNTLAYEKFLGWTGLLVEANPVHETAIKKNRPNCKLEMVAVTESGLDTVSFLVCKGVTGWSGVEKSIEPQHLDRIMKRQEPVETVEVPAEDLSHLLAKHKLFKIDYLSLDIEGAEYDALRDFDFRSFDIEILDIENNFETEDVRKIMLKNGYEIIKRLGVNDIYRKRRG